MRSSSINKNKDDALGPSSSNNSGVFKPKALRSSLGNAFGAIQGG